MFEAGDAWLRTGDLMRTDERGFYYFVDRVGDTFRWKGENVSTTEVEETIGQFAGVEETNVYGVSIPGRDGRAGMAAVVVNGSFDLAAFRNHLAGSLPDYARPRFIRFQPHLDVTSTFKLRKVDLVKDGFDPGKIADPIFFSEARSQSFVRLDSGLYQEICTGRLRL